MSEVQPLEPSPVPSSPSPNSQEQDPALPPPPADGVPSQTKKRRPPHEERPLTSSEFTTSKSGVYTKVGPSTTRPRREVALTPARDTIVDLRGRRDAVAQERPQLSWLKGRALKIYLAVRRQILLYRRRWSAFRKLPSRLMLMFRFIFETTRASRGRFWVLAAVDFIQTLLPACGSPYSEPEELSDGSWHWQCDFTRRQRCSISPPTPLRGSQCPGSLSQTQSCGTSRERYWDGLSHFTSKSGSSDTLRSELPSAQRASWEADSDSFAVKVPHPSSRPSSSSTSSTRYFVSTAASTTRPSRAVPPLDCSGAFATSCRARGSPATGASVEEETGAVPWSSSTLYPRPLDFLPRPG